MSLSGVGNGIQPAQYQDLSTLTLLGPGDKVTLIALVALGGIAILGGGIVAGLLYSHLGYLSLSCLGSVPIGIALLVVGTCTGVSTEFRRFYTKSRHASLPPRYIDWMTMVRNWHGTKKESKSGCLLSKQEQRLLRLTFPVAGTITKKDREMLKECGIPLDESLFKEAEHSFFSETSVTINISEKYGTIVKIGSENSPLTAGQIGETCDYLNNKYGSQLCRAPDNSISSVDIVIAYASGWEFSEYIPFNRWNPSKLILVGGTIKPNSTLSRSLIDMVKPDELEQVRINSVEQALLDAESTTSTGHTRRFTLYTILDQEVLK